MTGVTVDTSTLAHPPDGGWGWMVVLGSFLIHVVADGVAYTIGVFIPVLSEYFPDSTKSQLGWIGSIMVGVTLGAGPVASALTNRFGCRLMTIIGSFISALGFFMSYFAPNYYFLYFSLGIVGGMGLGLIYLPAIVILSYYFEKRRAFATGLAVCGSGVGTFVFAPLAQLLVDNYGWHGAFLIESAILLNCCLSGALFRPLPAPKKKKKHPIPDPNESFSGPPSKPISAIPQNVRRSLEGIPQKNHHGGSSDSLPLHVHAHTSSSGEKSSDSELVVPMRKDAFYTGSLHNIPLYKEDPKHFTESMLSIPQLEKSKTSQVSTKSKRVSCWQEVSAVFDPVILKDVLFQMFAWSNFLTNFTFFIPFVFLPDRAHLVGHDQDKSAFLVSIIGIFNTAGRILFGWVGDRPCINRLLMYNSVLVVCGIATSVSVIGNSYGFLASYAAMYGLLIGVYVTLTPIIIVDLLGLDKLSNAFGIVLLFQGIATMLGPPVAGYCYDTTGSYTLAFMLFGILTAVSGAMLYPIPCIQRSPKFKRYVICKPVYPEIKEPDAVVVSKLRKNYPVSDSDANLGDQKVDSAVETLHHVD